jgi:predicted nucleic acid-binding protein
MIYFDSDALVHYFYPQDPAKQAIVQQQILRATSQNQMAISVISLQEVSFVLNRLSVPLADINQALTFLEQIIVFPATLIDFKRAETLAQKIGFQNINDCLHTAIAEQHCVELITFNQSDFRKIQPLTTLAITIL